MAGQRKINDIQKLETTKRLSLGTEDVSQLTPAEVQTLVQELRAHDIELATVNTKLKESQLELQKSRDKYRALYNTIPVGYLTIDKKFAILEANTTAARMLGTSRFILQKSKFTDWAATPESQDIFLSYIRKILNTRSSAECEIQMQPTRGNRFWALLQTSLTRIVSARNIQFHIAISDITARKQSEESLRESESDLKLLWNTMARGVVYFDTQGDILRMNPAAISILGRTPAEFPDPILSDKERATIRPDGSLFPRQEQPSMVALRTGKEVHGVVMGIYNPRDKAYRWIDISAIPLFRPGENQPYQVYTIFNDITEQKKIGETLANYRAQLEAKVQESTIDLEESNRNYRALVENANEAIIVFQDYYEKFFNHKAMEISGYSAEELTAKPIWEFVYPDDQKMVIDNYGQRLEGKNVPSSYEFRMIHKNGSILWVEINAALISWAHQPAILAIMTDISKRKSMEQELKEYAHRITRVQEEERKRIAYELHDDTAQYLSIIKLQLDSILEPGKIQNPEIVNKLQYLQKDASRAVDEVRRYSHELRPAVLDRMGLQAALDQIVEDVNKLKQINVDLTLEGEEPELADEVKLAFFRIAQEALSNARKHSRASNVEIQLKFSDKLVKLAIIDNGIGFDTREATARSVKQGSLGMMSMQERARLIGADLKIESQAGQGTTVSVEMPL